jgi:hypothetical protein
VSNVVMLRAVLLDVGGTLWPDRPTAHVSPDPCLEQLGRLLPEVDAAQALTTLRGELRQDDGALAQDTHGLLARASNPPCELGRAGCHRRPARPAR